ncbi:unnamed protein product [Echinostoma caproni]|uniref:Uncharacterized protein n=1 Tax=Echinostoma caproni TaxID=27848 RepID=A0A183A418_9TREM|nr:unnamed protein product [Echinostoma caproni]
MPITLDRFPQKPIPPSESGTDSATSPATTTSSQNYRPTLPNYVLNSLVRNSERPASCPLITPVNGHGLNELDTRLSDPTSPSSVRQPAAKMHSSFTITFPKLPGFRRPVTEVTTPLSGEVNQRDTNSFPGEHTSSALYTTDGAVPHTTTHDENSITTRLLPHGTSWESGDVEVSIPSDVDQSDYHVMGDQNGGQGDSSSENLDTVSMVYSRSLLLFIPNFFDYSKKEEPLIQCTP